MSDKSRIRFGSIKHFMPNDSIHHYDECIWLYWGSSQLCAATTAAVLFAFSVSIPSPRELTEKDSFLDSICVCSVGIWSWHEAVVTDTCLTEFDTVVISSILDLVFWLWVRNFLRLHNRKATTPVIIQTIPITTNSTIHWKCPLSAEVVYILSSSEVFVVELLYHWQIIMI